MPTLQDYSVKFGRDPRQGLYGVKAIPFFYGLINHNDVDENIGIDSYGVLCKANTVTPHYVRLDPDYNYKLISINYSAYYNNRGTYEWYENANITALPVYDNTLALPPNPSLNDRWTALVTANGWGAGNQYNWNGTAWVTYYNTTFNFNPDVLPGTPYIGYLQASLSILGSGSQTLFGGQNIQSINDGTAKLPMSISSMRGYEYGFQALRCEYLVPMQGIFSFEFTNTHKTKDIYITAMMYGMKIRL